MIQLEAHIRGRTDGAEFAGSASSNHGLLLAHVASEVTGGFRVHGLEDHLHAVATLAAEFAKPFGGDEWAHLAGMWHDLGKFQPAFQAYIRRASGYDPLAHIDGGAISRVDHSTAGALHAVEHLRQGGPRGEAVGRLLAYVISGHHTGLPDWHQADGGRGALSARLRERRETYDAVLGVPQARPYLDGHVPDGGPPSRAATALWVRMLFSTLVDADFLDTERFMSPRKAAGRSGWRIIEDIQPAFEEHMAQMVSGGTRLNRIRNQVLEQCRAAAQQPPGLFSLTVPTGGGKTLASMAFALRHALAHGKRRIIYVIPYTSIIEQVVEVFRRALGEEEPWTVVLEHHSNLEPHKETPRSKLAAENWDAPVVVTTSVQFFESLFAARTSRTRKLHRLVDSVVVLDEVQLLEPDFLHPILDTLQLLGDHFGVSILMMTATQPAWREGVGSGERAPGLSNIREIVPDPDALHLSLRRVDVQMPDRFDAELSWDDIAESLLDEPSVLCVVNRRQDAQELFQKIRQEDDGVLHLSALMCGAHRSAVIVQIKRRLAADEDVRVVSTQLVEAGVDLDFPVVYRAMAGLDSIVQAAGRCNREGKAERGDVRVFVPPSKPPPGVLRQATDVTRSLLSDGRIDPLSPASFHAFFRQLFWLRGDRLDRRGIRELLDHEGRGQNLHFGFRTAASRFRLIDDTNQVSVVVRWRGSDRADERDRAIASIREVGPNRQASRELQRSVVTISRWHLAPLLDTGAVEELHDRLYVQQDDSLYDEGTGLIVDPQGVRDPEELIS